MDYDVTGIIYFRAPSGRQTDEARVCFENGIHTTAKYPAANRRPTVIQLYNVQGIMEPVYIGNSISTFVFAHCLATLLVFARMKEEMAVGSSLSGAKIAAHILPPSSSPVQVQNDVNPFCNNLIFHLFAANSCSSQLFAFLFGSDWGAEIVPARPRWVRCLLSKHNFRARFIA